MKEELITKDTSDRNLTCVLFPGIVKNEDRALSCLGGIRAISQVDAQPTKKRMGLSYNPDNPMLKKAYADYKKVPGVLFRVKVKKSKVGNEIKREVISTSVVARVEKMYKFESMCDYQYLPITNAPEGEQKCLIEQILPTGLDTLNFLSTPAPTFIVPSQFSRTDKPSFYSYIDKKYLSKHLKEMEDDDTHTRLRAGRSLPGSVMTFDLTTEWPTEPNPINVAYKDKRILNSTSKINDYNTLKKLFEDRPIWSINLIRYKTGIKHGTLKFLMPCMGVFMRNGPWRNLWIRFGYDPRKDPGARIYQTLDFRFRHEGGFHTMVELRDSKVHWKRPDRVFAGSSPASEEVSEGAVLYRAGMVPTQRQIYYQVIITRVHPQYCDIDLPAVQAKLSEEPPPGYLCHAARGWLPPDCDTYCRDQIFRHVKDALRKTRNADIKLELQNESSGDEEMNSDDREASTSAMDID